MNYKQSPTIRVSWETYRLLCSRKLRFETWLERATLSQVEQAFLPAPPHDRFGISLDTVIRRLLHQVEKQEHRSRKSRRKK